jgi:hypothetical protein
MSDANPVFLSQDEVQPCHVPLIHPPSTPSTAPANPRTASIAGNTRSRSRRADFLPFAASQDERGLRRFNSSTSTLRRLGKAFAPPEKIGTLDDLVITTDRKLFAVLQVGGFLGLGGYLVALPYESLAIDDHGSKITLTGASKDAVQKLPEFQYPKSS